MDTSGCCRPGTRGCRLHGVAGWAHGVAGWAHGVAGLPDGVEGEEVRLVDVTGVAQVLEPRAEHARQRVLERDAEEQHLVRVRVRVRVRVGVGGVYGKGVPSSSTARP